VKGNRGRVGMVSIGIVNGGSHFFSFLCSDAPHGGPFLSQPLVLIDKNM
jgi:hypothetical protein